LASSSRDKTHVCGYPWIRIKIGLEASTFSKPL
jgi:hypothetical protein